MQHEIGSVFDTLQYGGILGLAFDELVADGLTSVMTQAMHLGVFNGNNIIVRNPWGREEYTGPGSDQTDDG